ncbi:hypothetical protein AB0I81_34905 [Nonomuraea sp. NPDC050404]|uniref:hypothetical protein n=1 Tax=Nonomuraea sp. NPDC050404 TaxID=3155783 RepID=UPI00340FB4D4
MGGYDELTEFDGLKIDDAGCDQCSAYAVLDANRGGRGKHYWQIFHDADCPVWLKHVAN